MRGRGKREAEHASGVARIDDAVIPKSRGGEVRTSLDLIVVADRRLELLFVFYWPVLASRFELITSNGGQH